MPELPPLPDAGPAGTPAAGKPPHGAAPAAPVAVGGHRRPGGRSATAGPRDGPGRLAAAPAPSGGADAPAPPATPAPPAGGPSSPPDLGPPSADNRPGGVRTGGRCRPGRRLAAARARPFGRPTLRRTGAADGRPGREGRKPLVLDPRPARDLAPRRPDPPRVLAEARRRGPGARDPRLLAPGQHDRREGRRRNHHHPRPPFGPQRALQAQATSPTTASRARRRTRDLQPRS